VFSLHLILGCSQNKLSAILFNSKYLPEKLLIILSGPNNYLKIFLSLKKKNQRLVTQFDLCK